MDADLPLADRIDVLLPQTQCTKCGYAGCRPYAEAIARAEAPINQCPPGGADGISKLAALLGRPPLPLNPVHGVEQPLMVAVIDEQLCIGCTLCIQACPVDAILGAARRMHGVLPSLCTGCDLCVAPCPMDCIAMRAVDPPRRWTPADAAAARERFAGRAARLARERADGDSRAEAKAVAKLGELNSRADLAPDDAARKKAVVQAAVERARARRAVGAAAPSPGRAGA